jgi:hypothetical protein
MDRAEDLAAKRLPSDLHRLQSYPASNIVRSLHCESALGPRDGDYYWFSRDRAGDRGRRRLLLSKVLMGICS